MIPMNIITIVVGSGAAMARVPNNWDEAIPLNSRQDILEIFEIQKNMQRSSETETLNWKYYQTVHYGKIYFQDFNMKQIYI